MHREHPLRIARYSKKSIWLLIFPILRGAYHIATREELLAWLRGTWFDVLILCIILAYGWLNWYRRVFTVENEQLYVREGIIFIRQRYLPLRNLASMTVERPFWLRPVRASYLRLVWDFCLTSRPSICMITLQQATQKRQGSLFSKKKMNCIVSNVSSCRNQQRICSLFDMI